MNGCDCPHPLSWSACYPIYCDYFVRVSVRVGFFGTAVAESDASGKEEFTLAFFFSFFLL